MNEIYWITRLDNLYNFSTAVTAISIIAIVIMGIVLINTVWIEENPDAAKVTKKWIKLPILLVLCGSMCLVFLPTTKEALVILGVGGTVDYIKENETIKELPDKCVKALDAWVESLSEEEK